MLGLTVPISQARTSSVVADQCCCPDPAFCHCPDHDAPGHPVSRMQTCGRSSHLTVGPVLAMFELPPEDTSIAIVVEPAPALGLPSPHASPEPERPAAPS